MTDLNQLYNEKLRRLLKSYMIEQDPAVHFKLETQIQEGIEEIKKMSIDLDADNLKHLKNFGQTEATPIVIPSNATTIEEKKIGGDIHIHGNIEKLELVQAERAKNVGDKNFTIGNGATFHGNFVVADSTQNSFNAAAESPSKKKGATGTKEVFVSYAWGGESAKMVDELDKTLQEKGITIIRDKHDLGYKGRIKDFMNKIGRGKAVIVVISKKYLESENCMYELVQIAKNGQFYDRIFPIVLEDAQIYKPVARIKYVKHWEDQIKELDDAMKTVNSANLQGFREAIDEYTEIRATIGELTNILKDMNTLTPEMHAQSGFADLIKAIEQKLNE